MLTRLEVDGFKNLIGFSVDFGPFNCLAGVNGVGKSNIFDAIRFLSLLADHTLMEAALNVRESDSEMADPRDIFWSDGSRQGARHCRLAAEMIVAPEVEDDFGRVAHASSTYLRYEVELRYEPPDRRGGLLGRLVLQAESLDYIQKGEAVHRLHFPLSAGHFRNQVIQNQRRGSGFISSHQNADGKVEIHIHQDGGSAGQPQKASAERAPRTIVGTSNTSTTPTILAARREMQSWRFLALEPRSMRGADRFNDERQITESGDHLAGTLYRLAAAGRDQAEMESSYARIAARLAELVPVRNVRVDVEEVRQLLTLEVEEAKGLWLPARSLSDGTLRFLTLVLLSEDSAFSGLLCMEEPENGIHPARMPAMAELLRDIAVDTHHPVGEDNPLRQIIIATHSPTLVQLLGEADLLLVSEVQIRDEQGQMIRTLRALPLVNSWRARSGAHPQAKPVSKAAILAYLTAPEDATIQLGFPLQGHPR